MQRYEKAYSKPDSQEIKLIVESLRSPKPLTSLQELDTLIKPLPGYIGPGEWLTLLK